MEIIFEILAELLLQIVFELLAELGVRRTRDAFKQPPNPFIAAIGYVIAGAIAGAISLWLYPMHFTDTMIMRVAVLVLVLLAAGAAMALLGVWRSRRDQPLIRLDRFAFGYVFALALAVMRFIWGQ